MQEKVTLKFRGTEKDIEEVLEVLLVALHSKYIVTETSGYIDNGNGTGGHKFIRLRPMPVSTLKGLGEAGREHV